MHKRVTLGLGVAGIFLVGLVAGSLMSSALPAVINQLYSDGKIDAQQKAKLSQQVTSQSTSTCANLADVIRQHSGQGHQANGALAGAYQAVMAPVAHTLKLTTNQLESDLSSGKTVSQIASAQTVDISSVKAVYLSTVKAELAKAVTTGTLSQQQSTAIYQRFESATNSGHFPLLEHGANNYGDSQD